MTLESSFKGPPSPYALKNEALSTESIFDRFLWSVALDRLPAGGAAATRDIVDLVQKLLPACNDQLSQKISGTLARKQYL